MTVETVHLNGEIRTTFESTTMQFARGQFMGLTDEEKLAGRALEDFRNGVIVGSTTEATDDARARDVRAEFETVSLDPEPGGVLNRWKTVRVGRFAVPFESAVDASRLGAAARSDRAVVARAVAPVGGSIGASVVQPTLTLVAPGTMSEAASLTGPAASSTSIAQQTAAASGLHLVEAFEVSG